MSRRPLVILAPIVLLATSFGRGAPAVAGSTNQTARPGTTPVQPAVRPSGDFNGDGFADVAVGVPQEGVGSVSHAGAVNVLYGSANGITAAGNQFWNQNSLNVPDVAEVGDGFGFAAAAGDFNGDGFADLAVGVPDENLGGLSDTGMVQILMGSTSGLTAGPSFSENTAGMPTKAAGGDRFGWALGSGDFDGDGAADLAIGVPGKSVSGHALAGSALVLYGSRSSGLTTARAHLWTQDSSGQPGTADLNDHLGFAITTGDFNGDGFADLAAGVPGEDVGTGADAGAVQVIYGSANGLTSSGSQVWYQNSPGILDSSQREDDFGYALAGGDFNGDRAADLAVGVPFEDEGGAIDAGAVNVLYGSPNGLTSTGNQFWALDSSSMPGASQAYASFGFSLAAGNFDGDGFQDLAIGGPGHSISGHARAGSVNVLYGRAKGLGTRRAQLWSQDSSGINGGAESGDEFGYAVAAGDAGKGRQDDLFIGVAFEDVGSIKDAGALAVIYGSTTGVTSAGNQVLDQNSSGIADTSEPADEFGAALASGANGAPPA